MSYCVNCGVELGQSAEKCPLCGTQAWHPEHWTPDAPYFPTKPAVVEPVSKRALALVLTSMLVSVSLCCGMLNLVLTADNPWALYVVGATAMLWVWFVLPLLARHLPIFVRLTADVLAIGLYVFLIALGLDGLSWFRSLALPILAVACVDVFVLSFLLRGGRRSILSRTMLSIGAAALLALGVEACIDRFLDGAWRPGWSIIVLAVCIGLVIPLCVFRCVPTLREELRRRFSL